MFCPEENREIIVNYLKVEEDNREYEDQEISTINEEIEKTQADSSEGGAWSTWWENVNYHSDNATTTTTTTTTNTTMMIKSCIKNSSAIIYCKKTVCPCTKMTPVSPSVKARTTTSSVKKVRFEDDCIDMMIDSSSSSTSFTSKVADHQFRAKATAAETRVCCSYCPNVMNQVSAENNLSDVNN